MSRTNKDTESFRKKIDAMTGMGWAVGRIPSWFKRIMRRKRRAKEDSAVRNEKEVPFFKKTDEYDWW